MDTVESLRQIVERVMKEYAEFYSEAGAINTELVIDRTNDHYLLLDVGWEDKRRIYEVIIHLDIINGKVWIQRDGTEEGVATDLEKYGVSKDKIVLGFKSPNLRQFTEYAAA